jgi:hypothetical protein
MGSNNYLRISGVFFLLVAFAHFLRVINDVTVLVGSYEVPMWASWLTMIATTGLAIWAFLSLPSHAR